MEAVDAVIKNISRFIIVSTEEEEYLRSIVRVIKVRKKQYIVQPEFICKYKNYIFKGALRSFYNAPDGTDHTIALAIEDYWTSDFNSYINQEPATLFVEALEDSIIVQLEYTAEQLLLKKYPNFMTFFKIAAERGLASFQKRMLSRLSKTAEERYEEFIEKHADIANRVPQYALASYLGISTQHLSKIRKGRVRK